MAKETADVMMLDMSGTRTLNGFDTEGLTDGVVLTDQNGNPHTSPEFSAPAVGITIENQSKKIGFLRLIMPNKQTSFRPRNEMKFLGIAITDDVADSAYQEWSPPNFGSTPSYTTNTGDPKVSTMTIELDKSIDSKSHTFSILYCALNSDNNGMSVHAWDPTVRNQES